MSADDIDRMIAEDRHGAEDDAYRRGFDYGCQKMRERCAKVAGRFHQHPGMLAAIRALEVPEDA